MKSIPARSRAKAWVLWVLLTAVSGVLPGAEPRCEAGQASPKQLREDLEKARKEIERLRKENQRLRDSAPPTAPAVSTDILAPPSPRSEPSRPAAIVPSVSPTPPPTPSTVSVPAPVAEGQVVSVARLLADYAQSTMGGDARYKGRRFRIEGTVRSFKKVFVAMGWDVHLEGKDTLGVVRCRVAFSGVSDFRGENASMLEGRRPFREWKTLLAKGEAALLEGTCAGADGGAIVFKDCRLAESGK